MSLRKEIEEILNEYFEAEFTGDYYAKCMKAILKAVKKVVPEVERIDYLLSLQDLIRRKDEAMKGLNFWCMYSHGHKPGGYEKFMEALSLTPSTDLSLDESSPPGSTDLAEKLKDIRIILETYDYKDGHQRVLQILEELGI